MFICHYGEYIKHSLSCFGVLEYFVSEENIEEYVPKLWLLTTGWAMYITCSKNWSDEISHNTWQDLELENNKQNW